MGVLTAWIAAAGIQIYRDVTVFHRAPVPSEFASAGAIFGVLGLLDGPTQGVAGVIAWGFLIALALQAGGPSKLIAGGSDLPVARGAFPAPDGGPAKGAGHTKKQGG